MGKRGPNTAWVTGLILEEFINVTVTQIYQGKAVNNLWNHSSFPPHLSDIVFKWFKWFSAEQMRYADFKFGENRSLDQYLVYPELRCCNQYQERTGWCHLYPNLNGHCLSITSLWRLGFGGDILKSTSGEVADRREEHYSSSSSTCSDASCTQLQKRCSGKGQHPNWLSDGGGEEASDDDVPQW